MQTHLREDNKPNKCKIATSERNGTWCNENLWWRQPWEINLWAEIWRMKSSPSEMGKTVVPGRGNCTCELPVRERSMISKRHFSFFFLIVNYYRCLSFCPLHSAPAPSPAFTTLLSVSTYMHICSLANLFQSSLPSPHPSEICQSVPCDHASVWFVLVSIYYSAIVLHGWFTAFSLVPRRGTSPWLTDLLKG